MVFNQYVIEKLGHYVYCLCEPETSKPFYVGKGQGNRIFQHLKDAENNAIDCPKSKTILEINGSGKKVEPIILRHGLTEDQALLIESCLIDFCGQLKLDLTNQKRGDDSFSFGILHTNEIMRRYSQLELKHLPKGFVLININKSYLRDPDEIYNAVKEAWVIKSTRIGNPSSPKLHTVLAEYKKTIVGVFEVKNWYTKKVNGKTRWGFNKMEETSIDVSKYLYHVVSRQPGNIAPVRFNL